MNPCYLLITPPLTDPTSPPHSLSYLIGAAAAAGYSDFLALDANIEALNFLARPAAVAQLLRECTALGGRLETKHALTRAEQLAYRYALKAVGFAPDAPQRAIHIFRDPELFYHYPTYRQAVLVITRWLDLLSVRGFPGQFTGLSLNTEGVGNFSSVRDLTNAAYLQRLARPFRSYFDGPFARRVRTRRWDLVGLSVNYLSQLPFAIHLVRRIRALLPETFICLGGTEITDVVKSLRDREDVWTLFPDADAVVVGEGESVLVELLSALAAGRKPRPGRPGILLPRASPPGGGSHPVVIEDLAALPAPRYDVWDWAQYWVPEPVVLYAPTRGCYWNRCTFCDYGLNADLPTSPSRERPVARVVADLRAAARLARTVYFAVDAMSPRYLRRLASALAGADLRVRWGAELRLERSLAKGLARLLRDAGCVSAAFGYESGSQRVLDRIDKGVRAADLPVILAELAAANIGVQLMGFIGFPGETAEDARATFAFLLAHQDLWTIAGIGDFVLTPGAIVAQRHRAFGIGEIRRYHGDDIARSLYWIDQEGKLRVKGDLRSPEIDALAAAVRRVAAGRPFVGSIDSTHSLLYFGRYGRPLLPSVGVSAPPRVHLLDTVQYLSPFPGVDAFCCREDVAALHRRQKKLGQSVGYIELQLTRGQ